MEFATQEDLRRIVTVMAPQAIGRESFSEVENDDRDDRFSATRSPQVEMSR